ncbi:MAG TPA: hypothetical protein VMN38_08155 [Sphingomicrobium sp.]|nr:hypothetical protein [Sphingomicrobium sp.]
MSRPTIAELKLTEDRRYWPSRAVPGRKGMCFETIMGCHDEDPLRAKSARKASSQIGRKRQRKAILKLARKLEYEARGMRVPKSLASSLHMRRKRDAIFSHVWRLADRYNGPVTTATVIKRGWEFTADQLEHIDLPRLRNGFLADLNRRGAGQADGWLIGFFHGEWETPSEVCRLHLHIVVAGEMIETVDELRKGRNYRYRNHDSVRFRVRIDRKPLTDLPYPFTYCLKSYWPWKHVVVTASGKRRTRRHKRIPEPVHTQVLQFLDRRRLTDLVVVKHVSVRKGRLKHSTKKSKR